MITHGLSENDRLPPERDLAIRLQVSRPTLRNALNWLHDRGALRRVQGGGTFLQANFLDVIADYEGDSAYAAAMPDVIEARLVIEPAIARLAAARITSRDLELLHAELRRGGQRPLDARAWRRHELQFHLRLAQAAGNAVLTGALEPLLTRSISAATPSCDESVQRSLQDHEAIVEAVARRDGHAAAERMAEHLRGCHQSSTEPAELSLASAN